MSKRDEQLGEPPHAHVHAGHGPGWTWQGIGAFTGVLVCLLALAGFYRAGASEETTKEVSRAERLTVVETEVKALKEGLGEIRKDVKTLLRRLPEPKEKE